LNLGEILTMAALGVANNRQATRFAGTLWLQIGS